MKKTLALALLLASCGDPLVEDGYRGEPLFLVRGQVATLQVGAGPESLYRGAVFWMTGAPREERLVEQASVATNLILPDMFDVLFFRPPEARHFVSADPPYAAGVLVVYRDNDADRIYTEGVDVVLGSSEQNGFVYSPEGIDLDRSPAEGRGIAPGFAVIPFPPRCPQRPGQPAVVPPPVPARRCDAGKRCGLGESCDEVQHLCVQGDPLILILTSTSGFAPPKCR